MSRQLISSDEAVQSDVQHTNPCSDCPWTRKSLPGWLGGASIEDWIHAAHCDAHIKCHTINNQQCAGAAIYRRNVCKVVAPPLLTLPKDKETCFATPMEFTAHHSKFPSKKKAT